MKGNEAFWNSQREAEKPNRERCGEIFRRSAAALAYYRAVMSSCVPIAAATGRET